MALNYDLEQANDNYKFIVASSTGGPTKSGWSVIGVVSNELPIAGGNDYSSAKDVLGSLPIIGKALAIKDSLGNIFKLSGRSNITDFESRMVWNSSKKPSFSLDYKFYNKSSSFALSQRGAMVQAKQLHESVLPSKGTPAIGRTGTFFRSPLGYNFTKGSVSGTLSLQLGSWFRATKLLMIDHSFTPSIQVMENGQPLFVTGSFTLEPYELITYKEFLGYFR